MTLQSPPIARGLEGIVIGQTDLSNVDGSNGILEYRGYHINELATKALFEEIIYLLWFSKLPASSELETFQRDFSAYRTVPDELFAILRQYPHTASPMAVLRSAVSTLGLCDDQAEDNSPEANLEKTYRLTAAMGTIVAAWERIRIGLKPIAPRSDLSLAANFLYMMTGKEAAPAIVSAINDYLVMLADHGMNASTFSARATTSTLSDMYSAITTAIGTLKGAAHGGANEKAMRQFIEIGSPERVDEWFDTLMTGNTRIMGIGHRVYKSGDPRMFIFKQKAAHLAESTGDPKWYEIATRLEDRAMSHPYFTERKLYPNVDYYSAIVLYQCGIPIDQFTPLFAISRVAGWCAHVIEQWKDNRLMRPEVIYTGEHGLIWTPLENR